jgi:hypothetical protein
MVVAIGNDQHLPPGLGITHVGSLYPRLFGTVAPMLCIVSKSSHARSMQSECGGNMIPSPCNPLIKNNNQEGRADDRNLLFAGGAVQGARTICCSTECLDCWKSARR